MMPVSEYDYLLRQFKRTEAELRRSKEMKSWTKERPKLKGVRFPPRRISSKTGRR